MPTFPSSLNQRIGAVLAITTVITILSTVYVLTQMMKSPQSNHEALDAERNRKAAKRSKTKVGFKLIGVKRLRDHVYRGKGRSKNQVVIHFVRHGEGFHNVAQREWREDPKWYEISRASSSLSLKRTLKKHRDGKSEPYTVDNDPDGRYEDPLLTPLGKTQALELQKDTKELNPDLMIVSPLRRATVRFALSLSLNLRP